MTWLFFKKVFFFRCWSLSLRKQLRNKYVPNIFYTCLSSAIPPPAWTSSCHSIAVTCDMALGKPAKLEFFGKKSPDDGYMNHESSWLVKNKDSSKWFIEIILGLVESHPSKSLYNLKNLFFIDHWMVCVYLFGRSREHSYQKHATVGLHHWLETREGCDRREGGVFIDERLMVRRLSVPTEVLIQGGVITLTRVTHL